MNKFLIIFTLFCVLSLTQGRKPIGSFPVYREDRGYKAMYARPPVERENPNPNVGSKILIDAPHQSEITTEYPHVVKHNPVGVPQNPYRNKYTILDKKYLANGRIPYGHPHYDGSPAIPNRRFLRFFKKQQNNRINEPNPNWSMYSLSSAPHLQEVTESFEPQPRWASVGVPQNPYRTGYTIKGHKGSIGKYYAGGIIPETHPALYDGTDYGQKKSLLRFLRKTRKLLKHAHKQPISSSKVVDLNEFGVTEPPLYEAPFQKQITYPFPPQPKNTLIGVPQNPYLTGYHKLKQPYYAQGTVPEGRLKLNEMWEKIWAAQALKAKRFKKNNKKANKEVKKQIKKYHRFFNTKSKPTKSLQERGLIEEPIYYAQFQEDITEPLPFQPKNNPIGVPQNQYRTGYKILKQPYYAQGQVPELTLKQHAWNIEYFKSQEAKQKAQRFIKKIQKKIKKAARFHKSSQIYSAPHQSELKKLMPWQPNNNPIGVPQNPYNTGYSILGKKYYHQGQVSDLFLKNYEFGQKLTQKSTEKVLRFIKKISKSLKKALVHKKRFSKVEPKSLYERGIHEKPIYDAPFQSDITEPFPFQPNNNPIGVPQNPYNTGYSILNKKYYHQGQVPELYLKMHEFNQKFFAQQAQKTQRFIKKIQAKLPKKKFHRFLNHKKNQGQKFMAKSHNQSHSMMREVQNGAKPLNEYGLTQKPQYLGAYPMQQDVTVALPYLPRWIPLGVPQNPYKQGYKIFNQDHNIGGVVPNEAHKLIEFNQKFYINQAERDAKKSLRFIKKYLQANEDN